MNKKKVTNYQMLLLIIILIFLIHILMNYMKNFITKLNGRLSQSLFLEKTYPQPSQTNCTYSYDTRPYSYSNLKLKPIAVTKELHDIFQIIEKEINIKFNSVLLNLYRDGQDSNGWHADNEKELGKKNPIIA